jgi:hypothetical protein
MKWLYAALVIAAGADVLTRALIPASAPDVSPWVTAVGFGWGFVALKVVVIAAVIGTTESLRRIPLLEQRWPQTFHGNAWIASAAPLLPLIVTAAYIFGAWKNAAWL